MLYAFLLTIYTETTTDVYVEDSGLTGADCIAAMENYSRTNPGWTHGNPSCEPDHATMPAEIEHQGMVYVLPACETEDSSNCYWDAATRGNGEGISFYDIGGNAFFLYP